MQEKNSEQKVYLKAKKISVGLATCKFGAADFPARSPLSPSTSTPPLTAFTAHRLPYLSLRFFSAQQGDQLPILQDYGSNKNKY
jgi:hypothetical protein